MSVLPGNPSALVDRAAAYAASAALIDQAAEELRALVYGGAAKSLDGVSAKSRDTAGALDEAHERYAGTAYALKTYAVKLKAAQERADRADADRARLQSGSAEMTSVVAQQRGRVERLEEADAPASAIASAERQLHEASAAVRRMNEGAAAATAEIEAARRDVETAAQEAIRSIERAIADTNDGVLDHLRSFVEDVGEWLADAAEWVVDFLVENYEELQRLVATVTALLAAALILIAARAVLALVLGSLLGAIGVALAALAVTLLAVLLLSSLLSDALKPTPKVGERPLRADEMDTDAPTSLADVLGNTRQVDSLGKNGESVDETVVRITRVVGADGVARWQVTLPSTQEWLSRFTGDQGGTHDLDSNLALMLTPSLRSQYERAVLEAMRQAGVGKNDPVMLIGFSQGGIMAGTLAAYNSDCNWSAVVVSGAPIDHLPIPSSTHVVSMQHHGDPVPRLDTLVTAGLDGYVRNDAGWTTIQGESPGAARGLKGIHDADYYHQTLSQNLDKVPAATVSEMSEYLSGTSETHYYGWSER
ncbi:hypothetical protein J4H92_12340 [Leucobacter weissii]|uniref:Uncharacterized protein n=1 Tax=Leucobacter weissii TaxID=1983706 RepID=A0A939MTK1_9MICO|nr:hypothetical protein [Leucobacter weissii]MBO1902734.1 hypothetical protein [Leucobacter weissii]